MTLTIEQARDRHFKFMHNVITPDDVCGLNFDEGFIGGRHFCIDKRGHEGECTCHCGYHWPKETGVRQ